MTQNTWFLENVDLYDFLCPVKFGNYTENHDYLEYQKGDYVYCQQSTAKDIYLIAEGKVKLGYYDKDGNENLVAVLGKGEIFGEIAYLSQTNHKDFAKCATKNVKICKMSAKKAHELSLSEVSFALGIQRKIASNIQRLERKLEILFFKDVRVRLYEFIKDLRLLHHSDPESTQWIVHGLTQTEIGQLIGASRKTVSLLLNKFEYEGIIELSNGKLRILEKCHNRKLNLKVTSSPIPTAGTA